MHFLNNLTSRCPVNSPATSDTLTVLYDGACPLCRREIAHVKGLAERQGDSGLCFVDISHPTEADARSAAERAALLARFHVQRADGSRLDGAAAFVAMWRRLPGWRICRALCRCWSWPIAVFFSCGPHCRGLPADRIHFNPHRSLRKQRVCPFIWSAN